jgi:hypothetical protein
MKKVKVLFLAANPSGTNPLKLDEEIRAVNEKIRSSDYRDFLSLVSVWAVRPDDLLQSLNEHKPQIVHFSGHGSRIGEIILADKNGQANPVSETSIKALFSVLKDNIRLVVLNACYSKIQADAIKEIVECVVGMNTAIGDQAAITFAASFYRAIGFGRSVKESFDQGKVALMLEGIPEANTPELLCKQGVDPAQVYFLSPQIPVLNVSHPIEHPSLQVVPSVVADSQQLEFSLDNGEKIYCEPVPFASGGESKFFWSSDRKYVVKLFYRPDLQIENRLRALLGRYNVVQDSAYWDELFNWPLAIVKQPSLGVVYPSVKQYDLRELSWYLSPRQRQLLTTKFSVEELGTLENYVTVAIKMAQIVNRLEQYGLVHLDLWQRTFLTNVSSERIVLIDNDALMIPGLPSPHILSPLQCMAPELVAQITSPGREIVPSQVTVRHTLATLIYWLLLKRHPLIGPINHSPDPDIDEAMMFGERALFIEHPNDLSNRPLKLVTPYTSYFAPPVKRLIERAFIDGLHTPEKRPTAAEWIQALLEMKDMLSTIHSQ